MVMIKSYIKTSACVVDACFIDSDDVDCVVLVGTITVGLIVFGDAFTFQVDRLKSFKF